MAYWRGVKDVKKVTGVHIPEVARKEMRLKSISDTFKYVVRYSVYFFSFLVLIRALKPLLFEVSVIDFLTLPLFIHENILLSISILAPLVYHNLRGE